MAPWLIVGLGNPGREYAENRHNIGFMVADELVRRSYESFRDKFKGRLARARLRDVDVWVLEPMAFMNRSGPSVGSAASFYKLAPDRVVVVHDDLDLSFATVRVKVGGGHGGHNGLRSIFQHFGRDFLRVRCGIGRPRYSGDVTNFVLSDFDADERIELEQLVAKAADAVELIVSEGATAAMNAMNPRERKKKKQNKGNKGKQPEASPPDATSSDDAAAAQAQSRPPASDPDPVG